MGKLKQNHILIPTKEIVSYIHIEKNIKKEQISFGNDYIRKTNGTKFLSIVIDKNLTFKEHINNRSSKISKSIGIIHKLNHCLPSDT